MSVTPTLTDGELTVRPVRMRDARSLDALLGDNRAWLSQWEATHPSQRESVRPGLADIRASIRAQRSAEKAGTALPMVIECDGVLAGQLNVSSIVRGSVSSATIGYWVSEQFAGRGLMTRAVALVTDYCFSQLGLHRMEICVRPENRPSQRVVEKLGFRFEGLRRRFIHINGAWADHFCYAVVREEVPEGVFARYRSGAVSPALAEVPEEIRLQAATPLI